jgi:hypothetical protein
VYRFNDQKRFQMIPVGQERGPSRRAPIPRYFHNLNDVPGRAAEPALHPHPVVSRSVQHSTWTRCSSVANSAGRQQTGSSRKSRKSTSRFATRRGRHDKALHQRRLRVRHPGLLTFARSRSGQCRLGRWPASRR